MKNDIHIAEAAQRLGVSPGLLRRLEREGKIPPARCDFNGRVYNELEISFLRALGVGQRPKRLRNPAELMEALR